MLSPKWVTMYALPPETASPSRNRSDAALPAAMTKQATAPTAWTAVRTWRKRGPRTTAGEWTGGLGGRGRGEHAQGPSG